MNGVKKVFTAILIAWSWIGSCQAEELQRNPFVSTSMVVGGRETASSSATGRSDSGIRGILYSNGQAFVNLNGTVITVGDEVDGLRLLEVTQEYALFERGDKLVKMPLYADESDEENGDDTDAENDD